MNLRDKYPEQFKSCFDCSPPDGWLPLVDRLICSVIAEQPDIQIQQVKEKFGGLRFYVQSATDKVWELIEAAENESERTCQVCGDSGRIVNQRGWLACLCPKHEEERNERITTGSVAGER